LEFSSEEVWGHLIDLGVIQIAANLGDQTVIHLFMEIFAAFDKILNGSALKRSNFNFLREILLFPV
jgi:hypothetical protein